MTSELKALTQIISSSVETIVGVCEKTGKDFPSLSEPISPSEFSPDGVRNNPQVLEAITLAVAAATQLVATLQPPPVTLVISAYRFTLSATLGVAEATHVSEILRDAGPKGMHVSDIAKLNGTDARKLSKILRYLATNHWFKEVAPDVFANNLLSSLLDTGKDLKTIQANPDARHENSSGLPAIVAYGADECIKANAYLVEYITDPKTAHSQEPNECAAQRALGTDLALWDYYDRPEGHMRRDRFGIVMAGAMRLQPPAAILDGFNWDSIPKDGVVVDVGGGLGHVSLEIAKNRPDLSIILEDRPALIEQAKIYWETNLPDHVKAKKIEFRAMDFFKAQPKSSRKPDVYLLRQIIHDWSDKYCVQLLKNLSAEAGPNTKLLIVDDVVDYSCNSGNEPGPPAPLLHNLGGANLLPYSVDIIVFSFLNAGERTIDGFINLINQSGWKFVEVRRNPSSKILWPCIVAQKE